MTPAFSSAAVGGLTSAFGRVVDWLDARGRPAWIGAMVVGFIVAPPIGLLTLGYMIWSKRMCNRSSYATRHDASLQRHFGGGFGHRAAMRPSGNAAFDAYKTDMLRRLQDEQTAFEGFMQRLREAKDKSEFDAFMDDRARAAREAAGNATADPSAPLAGAQQ